MDNSQRIGWLAGVAGVAGLGGVAAAGAARNLARKRVAGKVDPYADVDFTTIYADAASTVETDDGLELAVRTVDLGGVADGATPELTVIFVHGFSLRMASWHFQRLQLAEEWADRDYRLVFFDHRGHGKSDPAPDDTCTIAQLGDDVAAVIRATAPVGHVVLVGHSMGGMSLMGLARRHSHLFTHDGPVAGVGLVATASRGVTEAGLGEGLGNPIVDAFRLSVRRAPRLVQAGRGVTRAALEPVLVAASFGPTFFSPKAGRAVEKMIQNTPIDTIVNFLNALETHDETTALPVIAQVPTTVVCGDRDRLTPLENSVRMYSEFGLDSRLVVVKGAGHMVQMEQPRLVTDAVVDLVDRARVALPAPRSKWWKRIRV
ncbi:MULTISPECIES: alpha/beta fold hydrolase [unclassified Gordonia (in: high G+C Gram-positive bacteria)]|uniref:alpha/beta fold hydrolase n=1 Tax=unclassified Gordonia (in: high G+C Gram-positive bacteria) TaxID=2657482 RepID=UPI001F0EC2A3|nr:alpha/beta hydrolase [Gordonia sp. ABSL49_1]MCH5642158.1 alpha/beta hydrolase [Gordonia sp. ABSL49_1]